MAPMISPPSSQLSAAIALQQLIVEHPELPAAGWSIDSIAPVLHGFVADPDMGVLAAYADVLGGAIRAANTYEVRGQILRRHVLKTVWRDVPVEVVVALPVRGAVEAVTAA